MNSRVVSVIAGILARCFKPKEEIPPSDWSEKYIRLDAKTSNLAGRYRLKHTPYLKQIYDDVGNPRVRKIILKKSAQIGATQLANNLLLYYVCNFTFPLLMIMPSKEAAQQFCERSLTPSIHASAEVKKFLTGNQDDLKKTEMLFSSCILRCIGAGSPSKLASNPAAVVIVDESDKQSDFESIGEAPALELAEDRTISFPNDKKIIVLSTPTTENTSVVHSQYLLGSQSKYFVQCPHCQHEQTLRFEQLKWESAKLENGTYDIDKVEQSTRYECEGCQALLTEQDKVGMVRNGIWRDTNPNPFPVETRSYHISALYSFNITWGGMAKIFLLSKDDVGKLRNFYNSYLGECFQQRATTLKTANIDILIAESPKYNKGELLSKPQVILMAADTQGDKFYFVTEAVFRDGSSHVIDWGEIASFEDLLLTYQRQYPIRGTSDLQGVYRSLIDAGGNRTAQVYEFCRKTGFRFLPCVGRDERQGLFAPVRETTTFFKGANIPLILIGDKYFKDQLYLTGIRERSLRLYLPQDTDDELKIQLTSEHLVEKKTKSGKLETFWQCTNRRNHMGDCAKYLEAFKFLVAPQLARAMAAEEAARQLPAAAVEQPKREYHLNNSQGVGWD